MQFFFLNPSPLLTHWYAIWSKIPTQFQFAVKCGEAKMRLWLVSEACKKFVAIFTKKTLAFADGIHFQNEAKFKISDRTE